MRFILSSLESSNNMLALTSETLGAKIRRNRHLLKGVGLFNAKYKVEELRLPPTSIHRQIREWLCYNFAAASFPTKELCSRLYLNELEFHSQKNDKFILSHPL